MADEKTPAEKKREKKVQLLIDYKIALQSEVGERVWEDLKMRFHFEGSTAVNDSQGRLDVNATVLNEGERNVLLYINKMLRTEPKP